MIDCTRCKHFDPETSFIRDKFKRYFAPGCDIKKVHFIKKLDGYYKEKCDHYEK